MPVIVPDSPSHQPIRLAVEVDAAPVPAVQDPAADLLPPQLVSTKPLPETAGAFFMVPLFLPPQPIHRQISNFPAIFLTGCKTDLFSPVNKIRTDKSLFLNLIHDAGT